MAFIGHFICTYARTAIITLFFFVIHLIALLNIQCTNSLKRNMTAKVNPIRNISTIMKFKVISIFPLSRNAQDAAIQAWNLQSYYYRLLLYSNHCIL